MSNPQGINQYSGGVRSAYKNVAFHGGYSSAPTAKKARAVLARSVRSMRSGKSPISMGTLGTVRASTYKRNLSRMKKR